MGSHFSCAHILRPSIARFVRLQGDNGRQVIDKHADKERHLRFLSLPIDCGSAMRCVQEKNSKISAKYKLSPKVSSHLDALL